MLVMRSGTNHTNDKLTLKGISTTRRHIYFYALLFLGTAVVHNLWRSTHNVAVRSAVDEVQTIVATTRQLGPVQK